MDIIREDAFAGKVAFVAGASSGINLGIAERLAELGAKVGIISRSAEKIATAAAGIIAKGGTAMGLAADVRDYAAVDAALARVEDSYGPIDMLISGAAGNFLAPVLGLTTNAFKTVIDIDLLGTFNVYRASFSYLRRPGASLITISAGLAKMPQMFQAHAAAAKAGVNNLTQTLAMEWGPAGIRVNAISPGPIADTEGVTRLLGEAETAAVVKRIPLRALGTRRDIADLAVFLCSDNARYITGTIIECDGGILLGDASANALEAWHDQIKPE